MATVIDIARVSSATDEIRALIGELDAELSGLYTPEQRHGLVLDAIFQPHIRFFVARQSGYAAGCGGVAFFSGFAEVKRMYVRRDLRGRGIADAILAQLCAEALSAGLDLLRLETGAHSAAAIRFYRRSGFELCPVFEPYASMPPQAIVTSVFLERRLSEQRCA
jgi:putative acetyltransferase